VPPVAAGARGGGIVGKTEKVASSGLSQVSGSGVRWRPGRSWNRRGQGALLRMDSERRAFEVDGGQCLLGGVPLRAVPISAGCATPSIPGKGLGGTVACRRGAVDSNGDRPGMPQGPAVGEGLRAQVRVGRVLRWLRWVQSWRLPAPAGCREPWGRTNRRVVFRFSGRGWVGVRHERSARHRSSQRSRTKAGVGVCWKGAGGGDWSGAGREVNVRLGRPKGRGSEGKGAGGWRKRFQSYFGCLWLGGEMREIRTRLRKRLRSRR